MINVPYSANAAAGGGVTLLCQLEVMRPTLALCMHSARITLFTRANCSLCSTAKTVISNLGKKRSFEYNEVDVMAAGQQQWKDLYEFDTPVVRPECRCCCLGAI